MKIQAKIYIGLLGLLSFTACSDWLDVEPKSQVKREVLFESESGYRDALIGVYTLMGGVGLYGGNETMGFMDILAQNYSEVATTLEEIPRYNYKNGTAEGTINSIWGGNYNAIANCNYILDVIDNHKSMFNKGTYEVIKGEALTLRAYLHFDLLRAFAPSYKTGADRDAIPYVYYISKKPIPQSTVAEVLDYLIRDVEEARELIKPFDPLGPAYETYEELKYSDEEFVQDGGFWLYRKSRMNYYGMTALLARMYLYQNNKTKALECAREVIDSEKFSLITEEEIKLGQYSLAELMEKKEYISSIYVYNMDDGRSKRYFKDKASLICFIGSSRRSDVFGVLGADIDWRNQKGFSLNKGESKAFINKYMTINRIPLLKLSEMYLIAAEASGDKEILQVLRDHRGYMNYPLSEASNLIDEITKEYRKEFLAEGQLFYYYKRQNFESIPFSPTVMTEKVYVLPMPDNELEFGDIKQ
ncbi:MAG TPA: RagB/SusD family nutrient uptake outer membrane protein [Bacteroides reticulotermitis]|nr:RagB/SusD family nutrient uptake outer membrane protein [Bacteroides reticulotermitis]